MNEMIRYFLIILGVSLFSSVLGGGFGALVAVISPEFVKEMFYTKDGVNIVRYSLAMGMIWGLFIGAAVGGFSALLSVLTKFQKNRTEGRQRND